MPWNKKKSYNLLKLSKKDSSSSGSYTKKKTKTKNFRLLQATHQQTQQLV